jgi:hypothetical protein
MLKYFKIKNWFRTKKEVKKEFCPEEPEKREPNRLKF